MIEIIRQEEKEKKKRTMPKDIRQIGRMDAGDRIYIEDRVYHFLHTPEQEEKSAYVLLGKFEEISGKHCIFIEFAIRLTEMKFEGGLPLWTDRTWAFIFKHLNKEHDEMAIVGCAIDIRGQQPGMTVKLEAIHQKNFGGPHQVMFLMDSLEQEESFYGNYNGHLYKKEGFYIYYDKDLPENASMSVGEPADNLTAGAEGHAPELMGEDPEPEKNQSGHRTAEKETDSGDTEPLPTRNRRKATRENSRAQSPWKESERDKEAAERQTFWKKTEQGREAAEPQSPWKESEQEKEAAESQTFWKESERGKEAEESQSFWEKSEQEKEAEESQAFWKKSEQGKEAAEFRGSRRDLNLERIRRERFKVKAKKKSLYSYAPTAALLVMICLMGGAAIQNQRRVNEIKNAMSNSNNVETATKEQEDENVVIETVGGDVQPQEDVAAAPTETTGMAAAGETVGTEDATGTEQPASDVPETGEGATESTPEMMGAENGDAAGTDAASAETAGTSVAADAQTQGVTSSETAPTAAAGKTEAQIYLEQGYYVVQKGDNLAGICRKIYQTTAMMDKICEINQIEDKDAIYAGQYLALPN